VQVTIKFLEESDDSYNDINKAIEMQVIPKVGECLHINGFYHRVKDVVYFSEDDDIYLHLGKSAQSPEEARSTGYGIWNSKP